VYIQSYIDVYLCKVLHITNASFEQTQIINPIEAMCNPWGP